MTNVSASVGAVLKPAGLDNSRGILSAGYLLLGSLDVVLSRRLPELVQLVLRGLHSKLRIGYRTIFIC